MSFVGCATEVVAVDIKSADGSIVTRNIRVCKDDSYPFCFLPGMPRDGDGPDDSNEPSPAMRIFVNDGNNDLVLSDPLSASEQLNVLADIESGFACTVPASSSTGNDTDIVSVAEVGPKTKRMRRDSNFELVPVSGSESESYSI